MVSDRQEGLADLLELGPEVLGYFAEGALLPLDRHEGPAPEQRRPVQRATDPCGASVKRYLASMSHEAGGALTRARGSRTASRVAVVAAALLLGPAAASARVDCSGGALAPQVEAASAIFVGRLEAAQPAGALAPGAVGLADATLELTVTRVLKGELQVGDRVSVRWRGFVDPPDRVVGGCRVPGLEPTPETGGRWLVIASGPADALVVANQSRSTRLTAANRRVVSQVAAIVRRASRAR